MSYEIIETLYQHHLESWEDEYWNRREKVEREQLGKSNDEGLVVRAAFAAGWYGDGQKVDVETTVENLTPKTIVTIATEVNAKREAARATDPKLLWRLAITYLGMGKHLDFCEKLSELKPGETLTAAAGEDGTLEILDDTTTS